MRDHYEIWAKVLGFKPEEGKRYHNPFRADTTPSVYFQWKGSYLRMKDWADPYYHNINCFDAVAIRILGHKIEEFGDPKENWSSVMQYIGTGKSYSFTPPVAQKTFSFDLQAYQRAFTAEELSFYKQFGITEENLQEDKITGCEYYKHNSSADPTRYIVRYPSDIAFIQWRGSHKKIYRPTNKLMKFTTDTTGDDYWVFGHGGIALVFEGHKDSRVAYNLGFNAIGLQSSTITPSSTGIDILKSRFDRVIYVGDWDEAGIRNGQRISMAMGIEYIVFPPDIRSKLKSKDIADLYREIGRDRTIKAINYLLCELEK